MAGLAYVAHGARVMAPQLLTAVLMTLNLVPLVRVGGAFVTVRTLTKRVDLQTRTSTCSIRVMSRREQRFPTATPFHPGSMQPRMGLMEQVSGQARALFRWLRVLPEEQSSTLLPLSSPLLLSQCRGGSTDDLVDQTAPVEVQRAPTMRDQIVNTLRPDLPRVRAHRWALKSFVTLMASLLSRSGFCRVHFSVVWMNVAVHHGSRPWQIRTSDPFVARFAMQ